MIKKSFSNKSKKDCNNNSSSSDESEGLRENLDQNLALRPKRAIKLPKRYCETESEDKSSRKKKKVDNPKKQIENLRAFLQDCNKDEENYKGIIFLL